MTNLEGFDARKIEPQGNMETMPPGNYTVVIESDEKKATKAGDGHYLELVLQVVDGKYKGRKLWDRLNIWNKNEVAKKIALSTMSSICHATGVMTPRDSSELHNKPMVAVVKHRKYNDDIQNEVKGYMALGKNGKPEPDDQDGYGETIDESAAADAAKKTLEQTTADAPWN